eukprot:TRINITY_DN46237_c0_g1_i1.p1 TRINITY_DN46237_c0_g1~~TRINITY_DN46237_c0_g1_i1.p1  ORF type:complete len:229 (+),score=72.78 TRINITY_DN46237_c0_g1_i1:101-787(+)
MGHQCSCDSYCKKDASAEMPTPAVAVDTEGWQDENLTGLPQAVTAIVRPPSEASKQKPSSAKAPKGEVASKTPEGLSTAQLQALVKELKDQKPCREAWTKLENELKVQVNIWSSVALSTQGTSQPGQAETKKQVESVLAASSSSSDEAFRLLDEVMRGTANTHFNKACNESVKELKEARAMASKRAELANALQKACGSQDAEKLKSLMSQCKLGAGLQNKVKKALELS